MTLHQLRIFVAVARHQHVTRAARELNLTQSAVSAALSAFEQQHGVRLFDRIGRGIAPTEAARILIPAAQALLTQAESTETLLDDLSGHPRGTLRLHASQTVAIYFLPRFIVTLRQAHREVRVTLDVGNTARVAQAVSEGTADLGFVEGDVQEGHLRRRVIARDELVLVMSRDHPKATSPLNAADYGTFDWILREPGSGTRAEVEAHLDGLGVSLDAIDVVVELPSNEAILSAVTAGSCVSMLSRRAAEALTASGTLVLREVDWAPRPERPFSVLTHPDRHRTRSAQALLDLIETSA